MNSMTIRHDPTVRATYIKLIDKKIHETVEAFNESGVKILIDLTKRGKLVGIEILTSP